MTTASMPWRCRRCQSTRPAGPAPTIPTCVRVTSTALTVGSPYFFPSGVVLSRRHGIGPHDERQRPARRARPAPARERGGADWGGGHGGVPRREPPAPPTG